MASRSARRTRVHAGASARAARNARFSRPEVPYLSGTGLETSDAEYDRNPRFSCHSQSSGPWAEFLAPAELFTRRKVRNSAGVTDTDGGVESAGSGGFHGGVLEFSGPDVFFGSA